MAVPTNNRENLSGKKIDRNFEEKTTLKIDFNCYNGFLNEKSSSN